MRKALDIIILALLFALVCLKSGRFLGQEIAGRKNSIEHKPETMTQPAQPPVEAAQPSVVDAPNEDIGEGTVTLEEAKALFPEAISLKHRQNGLYEVNGSTGLLGFIMKSVPYSNDVAGFMGPTPLLIALDGNAKVTKVHALKNDETPQFFERVKKANLLDSWNGLMPSEAAAKNVEAVSGATFSSESVIGSMKARMKTVGDLKVQDEKAADVKEGLSKDEAAMVGEKKAEAPPAKMDWMKPAADVCFCLLLAVALVGFFRPAALGKIRHLMLLASILVLAVWQGRMLSLAQFVAWITSGVPVAAQWTMLLLFLLSVLLPLIFGKAYYCTWVCPMGAAQAVLGELNKKHKFKLAPAIAKWLSSIRAAILFGGLLVIGLGVSFDFASYEAFTVFRPQSAPVVALCIGIISLLLSIWIPRPWCRFLCPLGELLEILRRKKK